MSMVAPSTMIERLILTLPPGTPKMEHGRWQRRALAALRAVTLLPPGMPPSAIFIIRHLAAPAPGLLFHGHPWQAAQRWEAQLRPVIRSLWRAAGRPAHGPISSNTPAVWFADQAEWLACLTLDLHLGIAHQRWWWHSWLAHHYGAERTLAALWQRQAQWLPAALVVLHERLGANLCAVVATLEPPAVQWVWQALATAYALPTGSVMTADSRARLARLTSGRGRFWSTSTASAAVTEPAAQLLTAALLLYHAPAMARQVFGAVDRQGGSGAGAIHRPGVGQSVLVGQSRRQEQEAQRSAARVRRLEETMTHVPALTQMLPLPSTYQKQTTETMVDDAHFTVPALTDAEREARASAAHIPTRSTSADARSLASDDTRRVPMATGSAPAAQVAEVTAMAAPTVAPLVTGRAVATPLETVLEQHPEGIRTGLGGVWYLVNVIEGLDLWHQCAAGMGAWRLLATIASQLLDERPPDPLWLVLDALVATDEVLEPPDAWAHWLDTAIPAIGAWLEARLVSPALPTTGAPCIAQMLWRPAVFYITRTHIDVLFHLEHIDLNVRLAGLDRNPGWLPALGRMISFYFD